MTRETRRNLHMTSSMQRLLRELWEWRKQQPEFMNVKSAGEYGRMLLLRVLRDDRRKMDAE